MVDWQNWNNRCDLQTLDQVADQPSSQTVYVGIQQTQQVRARDWFSAAAVFALQQSTMLDKQISSILT